jgi:hypothetical protein
LVLKNWQCVLPEDGAHVPKHGVDTHSIFELIKNVYLVGKYMVYASK